MFAALLATVIVFLLARSATRLWRSLPQRNADFGLE